MSIPSLPSGKRQKHTWVYTLRNVHSSLPLPKSNKIVHHHHTLPLIPSPIPPTHSRIPGLLIRINMPNDIVRQTIHTITGSLGHLGKSLRFRLIFKRVARKIDTGAMHVCFYEDIHAADAVEGHLFVLVGPPVAEEGHVPPVCGEFFVAFCEDDVFGEGGGEFEAFGGFLPGVVVDWVVLG